jgi:cobalt-zinc-cadmium efflux system protein
MVHAPSSGGRHSRRLAAALGISAGVFAVEIVAGVLTNSLALVADAGHVFVDACGMALSVGAIWMGTRPMTGGRTYGLYRLEVLAAVVNALLLFGVAAFVLWEGAHRLFAPQDVTSGPVVLVALGAIIASLGSLVLLRPGQSESLNIRGAYLEVIGDLLGSLAVLVAAVVTLAIGLRQADAVASLFIGLLILPRTWALLRDGVEVLLESTPRGVDTSWRRRASRGCTTCMPGRSPAA